MNNIVLHPRSKPHTTTNSNLYLPSLMYLLHNGIYLIKKHLGVASTVAGIGCSAAYTTLIRFAVHE